MNTILEKVDKENKLSYLMGDFNIDLFKSESCDYASHFIEQLFTFSFFPLITNNLQYFQHIRNLLTNYKSFKVQYALHTT